MRASPCHALRRVTGIDEVLLRLGIEETQESASAATTRGHGGSIGQTADSPNHTARYPITHVTLQQRLIVCKSQQQRLMHRPPADCWPCATRRPTTALHPPTTPIARRLQNQPLATFIRVQRLGIKRLSPTVCSPHATDESFHPSHGQKMLAIEMKQHTVYVLLMPAPLGNLFLRR